MARPKLSCPDTDPYMLGKKAPMACVFAARLSSNAYRCCLTVWLWLAAYCIQLSTDQGWAAYSCVPSTKADMAIIIRFILSWFCFDTANLGRMG